MKINELEPGRKFTLEASDEERHMQLKGTIANVTAEKDLNLIKQVRKAYQETFFCIADPIHEDNMLLNFESEKVSCNMIVILEGDKPYGWNNVKILNLRLPVYGSIHVITTKADAASYNRRQNYRVFIGSEGTVTEDGSEETRSVLVKDVSASGIGLIAKSGETYERGDLITVSFKAPEAEEEFHLKAVVVRKEDMDDGRCNIGCILKSHSDVVARFVYSKQKKKMKGAGASGGAAESEDDKKE